MEQKNVIVSVCMITYNHENFISEAIEGILLQKTTFPIELIIGEDCSTDDTRKIVIEYVKKYPEIIRPILPENNLGISKNFLETMQAATGKYIALCEGDDYWTDPYKLQKQVDFLEANKEYSMCGHRFQYFYQETSEFKDDYFKKMFSGNQKQITLTLEDFYWVTLPQILTLMIRKDALDINHLLKFKNTIDVVLYYCLFIKGNAGILNFVGGVYRKHNNGVYSKLNKYDELKRDILIFKDLYQVEKSKELKDMYLYKLNAYIYQSIKFKKSIKFKTLFINIVDFYKTEKSIKSMIYLASRIIKAISIRLLQILINK